MRREFILIACIVVGFEVGFAYWYPPLLWTLLIVGPLLFIGVCDLMQTRHTIRRNFPLLGNFRYLFEAIRPEINQYFVESNVDGVPFSREERSVVYQRAKGELDTLPFGTQKKVYEAGYEWMNHSLAPVTVDPQSLRVTVGNQKCSKPYSASIFNISAMSYGSLSRAAIEALNLGAKTGEFAHNTGEGGISPYHAKHGGDLIWQIGTGYFGCRTHDGTFDPELFQTNASRESVKMIEIKLSQGAKPGHGGILPAAKVTPEISKIRNVPMGVDVNSPPAHSAFRTPIEMMEFVEKLRALSEGKPIGLKLCVGRRREFLAMCLAMKETGLYPDYIAVDGGEGGTGAAPLEFSNHVGSPGLEGLVFVHNALKGFDLRDDIRVFASGKALTAFGVMKLIAVGADVVYAARPMMLALGCIQALRCHANTCPTGVATQDPALVAGLVVKDKYRRVARFHRETIESVAELLGAMGLHSIEELEPWHLMRRISTHEVSNYSELYHYIEKGSLLGEDVPESYRRALRNATSQSFNRASESSSSA